MLDSLTIAFLKTVYREWPRVMEAVNRVLGSREGSSVSLPGGKQVTVFNPTGAQIVGVRNDSGADVAQFAVLGIDSPFYQPTTADRDKFSARVTLIGKTPVIATHAGKFVITCGAIKNGEWGPAWISGVFPAKLNVTASGDTYADVQASSLELKSGSTGAAQILWKESGTGTGKYAIVRIGGSSAASSTVIVARIDSNRTRGECYKGYKYTLDTTAITVSSGTNGFAAGDIGSDGAEITLLNTQQGDAQNTHRLTAATQRLKLVLALSLGRVDDAGKPVYLICNKDFKICT